MIDNTKIIKEKLLDFKNKEDFYVCHIIQRTKDKKENGFFNVGDSSGDTQRLIKTFYIDSVDYFERKLSIMKEIADANHARLYFMPQVRNKLTVNRVLAKAIIDAIDEPALRYDHLIRTAVCGCHASRDKRWILDIDDELMNGNHLKARKLVDAYTSDIYAWWIQTHGDGKDYFEVIYETRNGWGVVVKPFDVRIIPSDKVLLKDAMMLAYCGF